MIDVNEARKNLLLMIKYVGVVVDASTFLPEDLSQAIYMASRKVLDAAYTINDFIDEHDVELTNGSGK